jgi:hypothetical protein
LFLGNRRSLSVEISCNSDSSDITELIDFKLHGTLLCSFDCLRCIVGSVNMNDQGQHILVDAALIQYVVGQWFEART